MHAPWVARLPRSPLALHQRRRSAADSSHAARAASEGGLIRAGSRREERRGGARRSTPGFSGRADSRALAAWAGPSLAGKGTVSRAVAGWASAPVAHAHASIAIVRARIEPDLHACVPSRRAWERVRYRMADTVTTDAVSAREAIPSHDARQGFRLNLNPAGTAVGARYAGHLELCLPNDRCHGGGGRIAWWVLGDRSPFWDVLAPNCKGNNRLNRTGCVPWQGREYEDSSRTASDAAVDRMHPRAHLGIWTFGRPLPGVWR